MSAKFGQITLKTRVMTAGDPLESPDGNTLLRVNDDGTATITSGGEAASTFTELAAAAGVQTVTDSTTLGDIQSGFGLSDSNTVQDAITASAGTSKQVATLDDIPAVPDVPVKAVKQNGASLTPDSNGAVNVKGVYYATCSTAQAASAKVATLKNANETFVLEDGVVVYVKFANASGNNGITGSTLFTTTLNVANTGAKAIYSGSSVSRVGWGDSYVWDAGGIVGFIYDGTYWRMLRPQVAAQATEAGVVRLYDTFGNTSSGVVASAQLTKDVATSIASYWVNDATTSYSAGDHVMYADGKLYKAKVDIAANTSWNASNWQAVTVMDEMVAGGGGTGSYSLTTPEQTTSTTTTTNDTVTVQLSDKAINAVQVPTTATNVVMKFPQQEVGKARDFFVRLIVTGETVPSITLTELDGSAVEFDVDDDSWAEIEQGVNLLMFTETAQ